MYKQMLKGVWLSVVSFVIPFCWMILCLREEQFILFYKLSAHLVNKFGCLLV